MRWVKVICASNFGEDQLTKDELCPMFGLVSAVDRSSDDHRASVGYWRIFDVRNFRRCRSVRDG